MNKRRLALIGSTVLATLIIGSLLTFLSLQVSIASEGIISISLGKKAYAESTKYWLVSAGDNDGLSQSSGTRYYAPMGYLVATTSEANVQILARDSYTLSKLTVIVAANTATAASYLYSRIGGASGNQVVTIPAGETGIFTDTTHSDTLVSGNLFDSMLTVGSGGSLTITVISYLMSSSSNVPIIANTCASGRTLGQGTTRDVGLGGRTHGSLVITDTQFTFGATATLSNLYVNVTQNNCDATSTVQIMIDGGAGNLSVSIPANTTGTFEDSTHSDNVAVGQEVNYEVIAGAGEAGDTLTLVLIQVKSTSERRQTIAWMGSNVDLNYGLTRWENIEGDSENWASTENNVALPCQASFTATHLLVHVSVNGLDGDAVFRIRKNEGNGNLVVTIGAGQTGFFEDTTHSDSFVSTDHICYQLDTTDATTGDIRVTTIGFEFVQAASEPSISVNPTSYDFGVVSASSTPSTATNYFTITNSSTMQTDQTISVTTSTWSGGVTWTHDDTCTPGANTAGLKANRGGTWGVGDVIVKYNSPNYIYENCPATTNYDFGLKLWAPTSFTDGVQKQVTVRITAAAG